MAALVLSLILLAQGVPPQPAGTIVGVLKDSSGKPAAGIRVAAVPRPEAGGKVPAGAAMSSQAETDAEGRYRLENVPPGRYLIAAGIIALPTFHPGTQAIAEATLFTVSSGQTLNGIDFALQDSSSGRSIGVAGGVGVVPSTGVRFTISLDLTAEDQAPMPRISAGTPTGVRLTPVTGGTIVFAPVTAPVLSVALESDYRITVEGLPDGYFVKSMKFGSAVITDGTLRLSGNPPPTVTGTPAVGAATTIRTLGGLVNIFLGNAAAPPLLPLTLTVTLARTPSPRPPGVSVTGTFPATIRDAYLSGAAFTIYLDDTFEFSGVQPGRHTLVAYGDGQKHYGASIIVGDRDLGGIELEEASVPFNVRTPHQRGLIANRTPGRIRLASVRGRILDSGDGRPLTMGDVFLIGDNWVSSPLNAEGKFEFSRLLPGKYALEVKAVGYTTFRREFEIDEQDLVFDLKSN